jgi:hypothetical protein
MVYQGTVVVLPFLAVSQEQVGFLLLLLILHLTQTQGKTSCLYLQLVLSMIEGCPFLYQTINGTVYHVSDTITRIHSWASTGAINAFIDADSNLFEPQAFIWSNRWIRIIMASSPKGADQKWMKQLPNTSFVHKYVAALWSPSELFLTGSVIGLQV